MDFPFYEIQFKPRGLKNGKYKAGCTIRENKGDSITDILPRWELSKEFDSKEAANRIMKFNALQFIRKKYGPEALEKVKIKQV